MNKKVLTLGLMLMAGMGATAQVSLVNPVPQEVTALSLAHQRKKKTQHKSHPIRSLRKPLDQP